MVSVDAKHHVYLLWWMWQFICHSRASTVRKDSPLPAPTTTTTITTTPIHKIKGRQLSAIRNSYYASSACAGCSLGTRLCSAATRDRARFVIVTALNSKYLEVSSADKNSFSVTAGVYDHVYKILRTVVFQPRPAGWLLRGGAEGGRGWGGGGGGGLIRAGFII